MTTAAVSDYIRRLPVTVPSVLHAEPLPVVAGQRALLRPASAEGQGDGADGRPAGGLPRSALGATPSGADGAGGEAETAARRLGIQGQSRHGIQGQTGGELAVWAAGRYSVPSALVVPGSS